MWTRPCRLKPCRGYLYYHKPPIYGRGKNLSHTIILRSPARGPGGREFGESDQFQHFLKAKFCANWLLTNPVMCAIIQVQTKSKGDTYYDHYEDDLPRTSWADWPPGRLHDNPGLQWVRLPHPRPSQPWTHLHHYGHWYHFSDGRGFMATIDKITALFHGKVPVVLRNKVVHNEKKYKFLLKM